MKFIQLNSNYFKRFSDQGLIGNVIKGADNLEFESYRETKFEEKSQVIVARVALSSGGFAFR